MTHRPPPLHVIAHRFLSPAGNRAILLGMFNGWRAIKQWGQASEGTVRATENTLWATENTLWATVFSVAQSVNRPLGAKKRPPRGRPSSMLMQIYNNKCRKANRPFPRHRQEKVCKKESVFYQGGQEGVSKEDV